VPWPKPSILHRARRAAGGGSAHDDRLIRARLAQAFGRLIRTRDDSGHFVVLSPAFPTRLLTAFPSGTPVLRLTLEQALQRISPLGLSPSDERSACGRSPGELTSPTPGRSPEQEGSQE